MWKYFYIVEYNTLRFSDEIIIHDIKSLLLNHLDIDLINGLWLFTKSKMNIWISVYRLKYIISIFNNWDYSFRGWDYDSMIFM